MNTMAHNPRTWVVGVAMLCASVSGLGALSSTALMTNSATTSPATLTSGAVSITLSGGASGTAWITATGVGVGTTGAKYKALTVTNSGAQQLRYALTSKSSSTTAALFAVDIVSVTAGTTCNAAGFAGGTAVSLAAASFGSSTANAEDAVIGDKTSGSQTGDQTLDASATQTLCLRSYVEPGAGRAGQASGTITSAFTFYAEQTANN